MSDIGSDEDFLSAIDATIRFFNDGDIVEGVIIKVDRDEVLVDIGYKTEGVIPSRELSIKRDVDPDEVVSVGDQVEAMVIHKADERGRMILSLQRAQSARAIGVCEEVMEEDGVIEGLVVEATRDGLLIDIGVPAFMPASWVELTPVTDLEPYVGLKLEAKIVEVDTVGGKVVLSRRLWLETLHAEVAGPELKALVADLRSQILAKQEEVRALEARTSRELSKERARARAAEVKLVAEIGDLRMALEQSASEVQAAREVARRLWSAMPPKGRSNFFQSDSAWLPEWIRTDEGVPGYGSGAAGRPH